MSCKRSIGAESLGAVSGAEKRAVPELLAPAGGPEALLAAVAAGADAVYLGLKAFSARVSALNFSLDELSCAARVAHAHGVRVYVALNIHVADGELAGAVDQARAAQAAGADAFIVADLGLADVLRRELPEVELHLSTQANVQSAAGVALARELGFARVTTSRELSLGQIRGLCGTGVEIEAFCHGAICVCYAGCCELAALTQGRSANRGACTQPCRFAYALVREGSPSVGEPGKRAGLVEVGAVEGDRLLCPRDNCLIDHVAELAEAGVASLKIEGRMKNPDYVYNVTRCYRRAIDAAGEGRALSDAERAELRFALGRSFNRGFTAAYAYGEAGAGALAGADFMSYERSINQGVPVGRLVARDRRDVEIELAHGVKPGDVLEVHFYPDPAAKVSGPKRWPMIEVTEHVPAGGRLRAYVKRKVDPPCDVYLVRSAGVLAETEAALAPLRSELAAAKSERAGRGCPRSLPGQSALCPDVPEDPREARAREEAYLRDALAARAGAASECGWSPAASPRRARTPGDAEGVLSSGSGRVCVYQHDLGEDPAAWDGVLPQLTVVLDEVMCDDDARSAAVLMMCAGGTVCRNLGQVALAREIGAAFEVAAPVAVRNARAAAVLKRLGARAIWLAPEVGAGEAACIAAGVDVPVGWLEGAPGEPGEREAMVCAHCLLQAAGPCDGRCAACARRREAHWLRGRDGALLRIEVDARGRSRLYAQPYGA